jgi:hypothetical protein
MTNLEPHDGRHVLAAQGWLELVERFIAGVIKPRPAAEPSIPAPVAVAA